MQGVLLRAFCTDMHTHVHTSTYGTPAHACVHARTQTRMHMHAPAHQHVCGWTAWVHTQGAAPPPWLASIEPTTMTAFVACVTPLAARGQFSKDEGALRCGWRH